MGLLKFNVTCTHCKGVHEVSEADYPVVSDHIAECEGEAARDAARETEEGFGGHILPDDLVGPRQLEELSLALRRRDWSEAELLLDKLADNHGPAAQEAVARGRYNVAVAA